MSRRHSGKHVRCYFAAQVVACEVRIIVQPEKVDDLEATRMARDIAKQIEEEMQYPGQIKVTVLRETRAIEIAK